MCDIVMQFYATQLPVSQIDSESASQVLPYSKNMLVGKMVLLNCP